MYENEESWKTTFIPRFIQHQDETEEFPTLIGQDISCFARIRQVNVWTLTWHVLSFYSRIFTAFFLHKQIYAIFSTECLSKKRMIRWLQSWHVFMGFSCVCSSVMQDSCLFLNLIMCSWLFKQRERERGVNLGSNDNFFNLKLYSVILWLMMMCPLCLSVLQPLSWSLFLCTTTRTTKTSNLWEGGREQDLLEWLLVRLLTSILHFSIREAFRAKKQQNKFTAGVKSMAGEKKTRQEL